MNTQEKTKQTRLAHRQDLTHHPPYATIIIQQYNNPPFKVGNKTYPTYKAKRTRIYSINPNKNKNIGLVEMDKKTATNLGRTTIISGSSLVMLTVILPITRPVFLEIWPLFVVYDVIGVSLIIASVSLIKKHKILFFKKYSGM